jgi:hypothetical protein
MALKLSHSLWPNPGLQDDERTMRSGVVCAVVVMRHLLSHLYPEHRKRFLFAMANTRGLPKALASVLAIFNPIEVQGMVNEIARCMGSPTFEEFMTHDSMEEHMWSHDLFRFFKTTLWRVDDTSPWSDVALSDDMSNDLAPEARYLRWDGVRFGSLAARLGYHADIVVHRGTGFQLLRLHHAPFVLRLRFSNKKPGLRFHRDLFEFSLRVTPATPEDEPDFTYRCLAVVKLRDEEDDPDTYVCTTLMAH